VSTNKQHTLAESGGKDEKRFWISRRGCSLTASTKMVLNVHRPEGRYVLDLSDLSERGVALELAVLGMLALLVVPHDYTVLYLSASRSCARFTQ